MAEARVALAAALAVRVLALFWRVKGGFSRVLGMLD